LIDQTFKAMPLTPPFMETHEIEAISVLLRGFDGPISAFEWGSGASTLYYGTRLPFGSSWQSVEHDPSWYDHSSQMARQWGRDRITVSHVPSDRAWQNSGDDGDYETFRKYVLFPTTLGKKFELILIDGRARVECMAIAWELLTDDGVMILHDAERPEYLPGIPAECDYLCLSAYSPRVNGPVELLLMAKQPQRLIRLERSLRRHLPSHVTISSNLTPIAPRGRILFLNTCYDSFLVDLYHGIPGLESCPYYQQKRALIETCFGDSDFYSAGMEAAGWEAEDLFPGIPQLQSAWARERGVAADDLQALVAEQVRQFQPDVIYLQDISVVTPQLMEVLRANSRLIAWQIASPVPDGIDLSGIDIIFSSFPHFVERFRQQGKPAWYQPLAFEPRILERMQQVERRYPLTFIGGISPHHGRGLETLEKIATAIPLDVWGYGASVLPPYSAIVRRHHGEVWGLEMFNRLASSCITLNRHIDVAENYANNMRMFEATGCGALLLTDYRDNLGELFEIGTEVVAYRTAEEAVLLARYFQQHPDEAVAIATAGQERTLLDHTYSKRMQQTAEIFERYLNYKYNNNYTQIPGNISYDHH
jgi:hypothetical protein